MVLPVLRRLEGELELMRRSLGPAGDDGTFDAIRAALRDRLQAIGDLVEAGGLRPGALFRTAPSDPPGDFADPAVLRIGIFPVAANPFHWMHLLCGLAAMAVLPLDKVVYVVAGRDDRKPDLLHAPLRHEMARRVLAPFHPLFAYSPISLETGRDGESASMELLRLNAGLCLHAFYIVGTDHCHRVHPVTGRADTIGKLEILLARRRHEGSGAIPWFSVAFAERGGRPEAPETLLDLRFLPLDPIRVSSTAVRQAIAGTGDRRALSALPYAAWSFLKARGLYARPYAAPQAQAPFLPFPAAPLAP